MHLKKNLNYINVESTNMHHTVIRDFLSMLLSQKYMHADKVFHLLCTDILNIFHVSIVL